MATGSDQTTGVLTGGSPDLLVTGAHTFDWVCIVFRNYGGGGPVSLQIYVNGSGAEDAIFDDELAERETIEVQFELGVGDTISAEADAATSISWFMDRNALT